MLLVPLLLPLCQLAPDLAGPLAALPLALSLLSLPVQSRSGFTLCACVHCLPCC